MPIYKNKVNPCKDTMFECNSCKNVELLTKVYDMLKGNTNVYFIF